MFTVPKLRRRKDHLIDRTAIIGRVLVDIDKSDFNTSRTTVVSSLFQRTRREVLRSRIGSSRLVLIPILYQPPP